MMLNSHKVTITFDIDDVLYIDKKYYLYLIIFVLKIMDSMETENYQIDK